VIFAAQIAATRVKKALSQLIKIRLRQENSEISQPSLGSCRDAKFRYGPGASFG
jgi:hypothetical protein